MRPEKIICLALMVFLVPLTSMPNDLTSKVIYNAYIGNQMDLWEKSIELIYTNSSRKEFENGSEALGMAHYGYIAWLIGTNQNSKASEFLEKAHENADILLRKNPSSSMAHSFKAAFLAYSIALSNYKAPFLGPKSLEHIKQALKLDSQNPLAWILQGNSLYYMPGFMGGSKEKALESYQKAILLFEKNRVNLKNNWLYINTLTLLANGYSEMNLNQKAGSIYEHILRIEPNVKWVKDELYPRIKQL